MTTVLAALLLALASSAEPSGPSAEEESLDQRLSELRDRRVSAEAAAHSAEAAVAEQAAKAKNLSSQLSASKDELSQLAADLQETRRRTQDLEESLKSKKADVVEAWVDSLPHQKVLTVVAGVLGAFSIVGPSSYTRPFLAFVGSAVGGLMIVSSACVAWSDFAGHTQDILWLDAALQLLGGKGSKPSYVAWAVAVLIGALRFCLEVDRRAHDVYWPSKCLRRKGHQAPEREETLRQESMVTQAPSVHAPSLAPPQAPPRINGPGLATPSTMAPRDNTPAFSMGSQSPKLPPLPPAPPVGRH